MEMNQRRKRRSGYSSHLYFDMHIYTTHQLKMEMNQREKEGVVIPTHDMHIYTTHSLKLGMDQRREKEGVVIPSHLYI